MRPIDDEHDRLLRQPGWLKALHIIIAVLGTAGWLVVFWLLWVMTP